MPDLEELLGVDAKAKKPAKKPAKKAPRKAMPEPVKAARKKPAQKAAPSRRAAAGPNPRPKQVKPKPKPAPAPAPNAPADRAKQAGMPAPKPAPTPGQPKAEAKPTSMAEAMKKAKQAYLSAVSQGAVKHDGTEPGEIDAAQDEKKEMYAKYREEHGGAVGKHEASDGKKIVIRRVPSGISGLDEMIDGGFKEDSTVLITGGPGCGKTTFLIQYLYDGALRGEAGLHISFEEDQEQILEDYLGFDWGLQSMIDKGMLHFLHYQPHEVEKIMEQGGGLIKDLIKDAGIKRVTLDSLTSFAMLFKTEYEKRTNVLKFFTMLESWGCTILLTSERSASLDTAIGEFGLEFLVDGAILMYNVRKGNTREQALEVLKMRATKIKRKISPITISSSGITVFPDAEVFTAFE